MLKNSKMNYGLIQKTFHWGMALLFFGMFPLGFIMGSLAKSDFKFTLYGLHKSTGLLLFTLVALRLLWRSLSVQPELPAFTPLWQRCAASLNIFILYCVMILMPVSGFLLSTLGGHEVSFYALFTIAPLAQNKAASGFFAEVHEWTAYVMIAAFTLHLLGALYHHYVLKDNVLKRMVGEVDISIFK
jgi:cytochrome b561